MKKILSLLLAACMLLAVLPEMDVNAAECAEHSGSNKNAQDYKGYAANTIKSYLTVCEDGSLMRFQYIDDNGYIAEYYDASYQLLDTKVIDIELPIFGAFYASKDYYFILTGQKNKKESASVECYRITKYDKDWNKIKSAGLYDCNTTIPFRAGSARITEDGNFLLIRTSHEMYTSDDGKNHQANVTIQVNMDTMEITDSFTSIMNTSYGYVSHSFNQFIKIENGKIAAVDHGDAYPRSVVLIQYDTNVQTGKFSEFSAMPCKVTNVIEIPGQIGDNYTGITVGGFEISDTSYLIAGNMIDLKQFKSNSEDTKNIFIASVSKQTGEVTVSQITNFQEGQTTTPQFVKLNNERFVLLWGREHLVYYTEIDKNGRQTSEIYSVEGSLSDCVPVVFNEKFVWYTWKNNSVDFYEIDQKDLSKTKKITVDNGHTFELKEIKNHLTTLQCTKCGKEKKVNSPMEFGMWWRTEKETDGYYYSDYSNPFEVGEKLEYWINPTWDGLVDAKEMNEDFVLKCSDPDAIEITYIDERKGIISFQKIGEYTLTIQHIYDDTVSKEFTFVVSGQPEKVSLNKKTLTLNPKKTYTLKPTLAPKGTAATYNWTSGDKKVATVDKNGKVTAVGKGKTKITVKTENGKKATCTVTVKEAPKSVKLSKEITLKKGETYSLKAVLTPSDAYTTYTWTSDNKKVATVDKKGKVTAVGKGTAKITVKTANGKTAVCKVTIK